MKSIFTKRAIALIIAIYFVFAIFPEGGNVESSRDSPQEVSIKDASVSIKFYDRTMYYPGDPDSNPIYVRVTVTNKGTGTLHFKLADDRQFSMDFRAYTVKNTLLDQNSELIRKRTTNQRIYFREISLEAGEEYSFVENVKKYLDIASPSMYYLELDFYPELVRESKEVVRSNRLSMDIRPSPSAAASIKVPIDANNASILQAEEISPDRVVEQTIIARQKSLWDQFFLYIDIEEMYKNDSVNARRYAQGSYDDRVRMLNQYKADLMQERMDRDIVSVPRSFKIEKTSYTANEGTVTVLEWFSYESYMEKKRYTYYVRQRDGIWQIYSYSVDNLGTE